MEDYEGEDLVLVIRKDFAMSDTTNAFVRSMSRDGLQATVACPSVGAGVIY